MARTFSIITTSKGRLEHLKLSLPQMLRQNCSEVIVVDFSCPEGTGDYVRTHFPAVKVVAVEGEDYFSNWKARNAGAAAASSNVLIFCDADTVLADDAGAWISDTLPERAFGFFERAKTVRFNTSGLRLAANQLRGFHVIPAAAFRRLGGYDEVFQGYAAGADTDMESRLKMMGIAQYSMDPNIIGSVIEHDNSDRTRHHRDPTATSYCAGLLYRKAKDALLRIRRRLNLPLETRINLYETAREAAAKLGSPDEMVGMEVRIEQQPLLMPRQLGYEKGIHKISLRVEVSVEDRLAAIPD